MEIIITLSAIFITNSLVSPSWYSIVFQVVLFGISVLLSAPRISNELMLMRRNERREKARIIKESIK